MQKRLKQIISFALIFSMMLVPFEHSTVHAEGNKAKTIKGIIVTLNNKSSESSARTIYYAANDSSDLEDTLDEDDITITATYSDDTTGNIAITSSDYQITTNVNKIRTKEGAGQLITAELTYKNADNNDIVVKSPTSKEDGAPEVTILPSKTVVPSAIALKLKDENRKTFYAANELLSAADTLDLDDLVLDVTYDISVPKDDYFESSADAEKYTVTTTTKQLALPTDVYEVTTNINDVRSKVGEDQEINAKLKYIAYSDANTETYKYLQTTKALKVTIIEPKEINSLSAIKLKLKDTTKKFYVDNGVMGKNDTLDIDDVELIGIYSKIYNTDNSQYTSKTLEEKTIPFASEDYTVSTNIDVIRKLVGSKQELTAELKYKGADGKDVVIKTVDSATAKKENTTATTATVSILAPYAVNGVVTISPQNFAESSHNSTGVKTNDIYTDKAEIQDALDLASANYTLVVNFPEGTYYIGGPLYIHSNTTLKLANKAIIRRNSNKDDSTTRTGRDGVNHNLLKVAPYNSKKSETVGGYANASNIIIEGGTFDGGNLSEATSAANVINIGHVNNFKLKNSTVMNAYGNHLVELVAVQNAEISGCTFTGFKYVTSQITDDDGTISYEDSNGDLAEAIQLDVAHKDSSSAWTSAYLTDDTPCANITIHNNTFKDYPVAIGNHHTLDGHHHNNISITNNTITGTKTQNSGIKLFGCDNSVASNNIISNYSTGIKSSGSIGFTVQNNNISNATYGVIGTDASSGQIISNTIDRLTNQGIIVYGAGTSALAVSNNIITNSNQNGIIIHSGASCDAVSGNKITSCSNDGIQVYNSGKVKSLTKNTINKCSTHGISIYASANVPSITNNTITTCNGTGITAYSSAIATTIKSNKIYDCGKYGIYVYGSASVKTLSSNTIQDTKKNGIYVKNDKIKITFKSNKLTRVGSTAIKIDSKLSAKKTQKYTFAPKVSTLNLGSGIMTTQASNLKKIKLKVGNKSYTKSTTKKKYTFKFKKYTKKANSATVTFTDKNKNTVARVLEF